MNSSLRGGTKCGAWPLLREPAPSCPRQAHLVDDLRLVVSELATNAVVHAKTSFGVSLSRVQRSVLLAIRDGSKSPPNHRPRTSWT